MIESNVSDIVSGLRATFNSHKTKSYRWRIEQLKALDQMLLQHGKDFEAALYLDLAKNPTEAYLTEIGFLRNEITHTIKHLKKWIKPRSVKLPLSIAPAKAQIVREPLGVVLIIAPWNYPLMLALSPLIGAIAAGNAAVVKPSELAPNTANAIAEFLPKYLDNQSIRVVLGGVDETTALLAEKFDHIFYTGNGAVGRIVMAAAAKNLTPVTLELGGKSPSYVDDTVDVQAAANRIVWAKFVNAGQTCVAPDYVLTTDAVAKALKPALAKAITWLYGKEPKLSHDFARIINQKQFDRLQGYLSEGTIALGGDTDPDARYIAPTILTDVIQNAKILDEEIFGPILPILTVSGLDEAISYVNRGDKPLALYVFSDNRSVRRRWMRETSSGALGFNLALAHTSAPELPFGGVGESGIGAYHGEKSVALFSHEKPVLSKSLIPDTMRLVYPPYSEQTDSLIRKLLGKLS